jgi:hypothetical protein
MNVKIVKKYKALGLLEMLIAMGVAGIAMVVFMAMATNSMKEAIRYERHDALTRTAVTGALATRKHAEDAKDPENLTLEFPVLSGGRCYRINFDAGRVIPTGSVMRNSMKNTSTFYKNIVYDEGENITDTVYVGYCINSGGVDSSVYVGNIVVGYIQEYDGIEEYEHPLVIVAD